jgi:hypothetical protein
VRACGVIGRLADALWELVWIGRLPDSLWELALELGVPEALSSLPCAGGRPGLVARNRRNRNRWQRMQQVAKSAKKCVPCGLDDRPGKKPFPVHPLLIAADMQEFDCRQLLKSGFLQ